MNNNSNKIMSAVIKVDIDDNYQYKAYFDRTFVVPYDANVEEIMSSIKKCGIDNGIPISRVYLSGHTLSSPSSLWTEKKIESYYQSLPVSEGIEIKSAMKR